VEAYLWGSQSKIAYQWRQLQTRFPSVAFSTLRLPYSLTSESTIVCVPQMNKEPGVVDEAGSSQAQPHSTPLPPALCTNMSQTPNSRQCTDSDMIFHSSTMYISYMFSLYFLCIDNKVYHS